MILKYSLLFSLVLILLPYSVVARDVQNELEAIQAEKVKINSLQKALFKQSSDITRELEGIDRNLISVNTNIRHTLGRLRHVNQEFRSIDKSRRKVQSRVDQLKQGMRDQVRNAFMQQGTGEVFSLVSSGEIASLPHRKLIMERILSFQEGKKKAFVDEVNALQQLVNAAEQKRNELSVLRDQQKKQKTFLASQRSEKRQLLSRVSKDQRLSTERNRDLEQQEYRLQQLLDAVDEELISADKVLYQVIRKRKGKLEYPLIGKIVAGFGSRPAPGRPTLTGVQMVPKKAAQGLSKDIHAISAGRVRFSDWFGGMGLMMIVDHGDGVLSIYGHNEILYKEVGDWVQEGETIAVLGSTGWVSTPRLHFEIRDAGKPSNPKLWCAR